MNRKTQEAGGLRAVQGSTLEERKRERRERLIDAGVALFGERGYHGVTVRDVCAEARLTERYFYESFNNLPALFIASYERANRPLRQRTMQALLTAERTPLALARAALDVLVRYLGENPRCARILLFESVAVGGDVLRYASESTDEYVLLLRGFLDSVAPGGLPPARTDFIASSLIGATVYAAMHWHREGYRASADEVIESVFVLYRGLHELKLFDKALPPGASLPVATRSAPAKRKAESQNPDASAVIPTRRPRD